MSQKFKISLTVLLILILVGVAAGIYWYLSKETRLYNQIKDKPNLVDLWNRAKSMEEKIVKKPEEAGYYMELGLIWKSLGELSPIKEFLYRSLFAYERGIERFGQKNILFYLNAGNLAEQLDNNVKAELYFQKAIEISPADESGYIELADLYSYKLKKSQAEVIQIYESGIKIMAKPLPLISARGSYLRRIGDYKNALEDYKVLNINFPDYPGYKVIIQELEQKLK